MDFGTIFSVPRSRTKILVVSCLSCTHVRKSYIVHKQTKSLQIGSHMFLNVHDELGPVPSILGEVVGVVSQHDATFSRRYL